MLFGVIGFLTGLFGRLPNLLAATCAAVIWGLIDGWITQKSLSEAALWVLALIAIVQAMFLVGLALRTFARR